MSKPKIFIGSSHDNIEIADAIKENLEGFADIKIWTENFFKHNKSFLQSLLESLDDFDYAIFIYAADDKTEIKRTMKNSPRDNVVFESGLFMGALGPSRVFIIYDQTKELKIPTDFSGIKLYSFNGRDIKEKQKDDVSLACSYIKEEIKSQTENFAFLRGKWKSMYKLEFKEGTPIVSEEVKVSAHRDGVKIESMLNPQKDYYTAYGKVNEENNTIYGTWKSRENESDKDGSFMLFLSADRDSMYGYFTAVDQRNGVLFTSWVLTKDEKEDDASILKRLCSLQQTLTQSTMWLNFSGMLNSTAQ